jgi:endo-beta-N-acetylglucosaminidase D
MVYYDGSIANASANFAAQASPSSPANNGSILTPSLETHIGQNAAAVALGHTPSTINDAYLKGTGDYAGFNFEYIQYDQIFVYITTSPSSS